MNNLYETLEICLQELEHGAEIETVLSRYPDLADELRPILEGSVHARSMAVAAPAAEVVRRNRTKLMQHAAEMREASAQTSQRLWFASLRRIAVTLAVVTALFVSGTSLVRAASSTLPGDNLYPVKRTWEDVLLLLTFNPQERESLEIEHENERLHEVMELFAEGRSAEVDFAGTVTSQSGEELIVNGVRVVISSQTEVREGPISVGSAVRVRGWTQGTDTVMAERIRLLSSDDKLPDVEYEHKEDDSNSNEGSGNQEDNSGPGSGGEDPVVEETRTPDEESIEGVVISIEDNILVINGITMDISAAEEIRGTPAIGVPVKVRGYFDANGIFIVTRIEFENEESNSNSGSTDDTRAEEDNSNSGSGNSNDNSDDDNSGSGNDNQDDHSGNENGDDSSGRGDNSGPGGGGNDNNDD